ncbi:arginine--tRNA ligase [Candidatus Saccharibacteria bacterium]|nr:arginine--tRNA ligase [Candidatus Saccharibacteria bacterium]
MNELKNCLQLIISSLFSAPESFSVEVTPAPALDPSGDFRADYSTNVAMKLAGILHKPPREVAETLATELSKTVPNKFPELKGVKTSIAGPGFINFMLPDEYFSQKIAELSEDFAKNISCNEYSGKVVVTEFSDPNPFKVLHIGHLYTSIMGESISKLIEFAGGEVHRVNFGGDVGLHVAKTLYALEKKHLENFTIEDIANCYVEGTKDYDESEEARQAITSLNKEIYQISEKNLHDSKLAKDYWRGRELSYAYFDQFYDRLGVHFEKYYPESSVAGKGLKTIKSHPEVYEESNGALVFKGEPYGLHTRVFVNKEGLPTYEAKDVGLLFTKNSDYSFDESVVITGNDIIDYMKVVLKSVEQYAPDLVEKTTHLTHGNVRLPGNQKMSSRKGNFIKAVDILNEVEKKAGSKIIADAAIKYSLLKYKIGGNIEFNIDESISLTGNSGPYLLYSAVRAKKILKEVSFLSWRGERCSSSGSFPPATAATYIPDGADRFARRAVLPDAQRMTSQTESGDPDKSARPQAQKENPELPLIKSLLNYHSVLADAVREKAPHLICNYLFDLAQTFSRFYETCRVKGDEKEAERARLVELFQVTMTHGLNLLGISVPEEM